MRSAATAAPLIRLQALHRMREARARFLRARNVLASMQVGSPPASLPTCSTACNNVWSICLNLPTHQPTNLSGLTCPMQRRARGLQGRRRFAQVVEQARAAAAAQKQAERAAAVRLQVRR